MALPSRGVSGAGCRKWQNCDALTIVSVNAFGATFGLAVAFALLLGFNNAAHPGSGTVAASPFRKSFVLSIMFSCSR